MYMDSHENITEAIRQLRETRKPTGQGDHEYLLALHIVGHLPLREDFVTQFLERPTSEIRIFRSGPLMVLIMGVKRSKVVVDRIDFGHGSTSRLLQMTQLRWDKVLHPGPWPKALRSVMNPAELAWYSGCMRELATRFVARPRPRVPRRAKARGPGDGPSSDDLTLEIIRSKNRSRARCLPNLLP